MAHRVTVKSLAHELMPRENVPNGKSAEFRRGYLRIPILAQGGLNIEHGEYASDDEVHALESIVPAGADPRHYECGH